MVSPRAYTPARIMRAYGVGNPVIRREVVAQCRDVARSVRWSSSIPRDRMPHALWAYVRDSIPYVEQGNTQSIRRPAALVDGGMTADCKSTAVFIGGLAAAAGCDVVLRFVEYPGKPWLSHVYALVDGVSCDPLCEFGWEDPYIRSEDHLIAWTLK